MNWEEGAIAGVALRVPTRHEDPRGWLAELFRRDECPPHLFPAMGYVSVTLPGATRGPHEHREQTDRFAFLGPGVFRVWLWDRRAGSPTFGRRQSLRAGDGCPLVALVPPGVVHAYRNIADVPGWVLNFPDRLYGGEGRAEPVDEIRHEDAAPGTFPMTD